VPSIDLKPMTKPHISRRTILKALGAAAGLPFLEERSILDDHYPPARNKAAFDARATANGGIQWLARHAREHGKKVLVPEWGIAPGSGANGGGDNPDYIQWMFEAFQGWHAEGLLAGEFYFADRIGGGNVDSDLIGGNPLSRARYVSLWKERAPAAG
jgi:hypothetical protein